MNRFGVLSLLAVISLVVPSCAINCRSPPRRTRWNHCCHYEGFLSPKIVRHCAASFSGDKKKGSHRHLPSACFLECVLSKTGVMNGDAVDPAKLTNYLKSTMVRSPVMIPLVHKAFMKCSQNLMKLHEEMKANPPQFPPLGKKNCKACSGALLNCVQMETIFNCPARRWRNERRCNAHRKFYKTCKPPLRPHWH